MGKIKRGIRMVVNPEQSRKVQEICFENDIGWVGTNEVVQLTDKPFLFIDETISFMGEDEVEDFLEEENEEVSAELFIRTNGTCVESGVLTENNNKSEQMKELKLECLVEGYEGTNFEVGQVWETRRGDKLKVKGFDFRTNVYKLILTEVGDSTEKYYYSAKGEDIQGRETDLNLVKLISTEATPSKGLQLKTLSEYLKETNAYESFVENCVESILLNPKSYECIRGIAGNIGTFFTWNKTKEGHTYWLNLHINQPNDLVYDMNEIIFEEVDKRIAEQKAQPKTLSEYLKETNAYESFVENCVESILLNPKSYECIRGIAGNIGSFFSWYKSKEGFDYWNNLQSNIPEPIEYDMNEIIFEEVDKRIAEQKAQSEFISTEEFDQMFQQKATTKYMVFVEGRSKPKKVHDSYDSAEKEAKRLSAKEIGCNVMVLSVVNTFKSKIIVEEI